MSKRPADDTTEEQPEKFMKASDPATGQTSKADPNVLALTHAPQDKPAEKAETSKKDDDLLPVVHKRISLEGNPAYFALLRRRNEVGYRRGSDSITPAAKSFEINVDYFRKAMADVLTRVLRIRYLSEASKRSSDIDKEIKNVVPYTVDIAMTAFYAKLKNINKVYSNKVTRYTSPPSYTKDIELPLPIALAIEEFGCFQTQCLKTNYLYVPTYPEGTTNEGRANAAYPSREYTSYLPIFKKLGILMKSIDTRSKMGSAWWTYRIVESHNCADLQMTLPCSLYSDQSAILRSIFCYFKDNTSYPEDLVKFDKDEADYGSLLVEITPGFAARSFSALIHSPEEEWSFGYS